MKIFITGGSGFIGKYVVEKLEKDKNNELFLLSNDLKNIKNWQKELISFKPEVAIHLAWEGLPDYGVKKSINNLKYGLDLFNLLAKIGCETVLSTGSCWEYGEQSGKLSEERPIKNNNAFTAAKNSLHWLGSEIAKENNMQFIWTRLFYIYGPGQRKTSIIPYLINCAQSGEIPQINNPLAQNDFIYVEDVAEGICMLLQKPRKSGVYNIGSGKLTSLKDIIMIIIEKFNLQEKWKDVIPKKTSILSTGFYADISKINKEVGWEIKTSIEKGISKMIF